jgi:hypothetical protein
LSINHEATGLADHSLRNRSNGCCIALVVPVHELVSRHHHECHRYDWSLLTVLVLDRIYSLQPSPLMALFLVAVDLEESTLDWPELRLITLYSSCIDSFDLVVFP